MLLGTLRNGRTLAWRLWNAPEVRDWLEFSRDPERCALLTSLSLRDPEGGGRVDLPLPRRFDRVLYRAEALRDRGGEVVGERLEAQLDDVTLSITLRTGERSGRVRVDLDRRGRRRWGPVERSS